MRHFVHPQIESAGEVLTEFTVKAFLQVNTPRFERNRTWRCTFNDALITATLADDAFAEKVENGQTVLVPGEILECDILTRQMLTGDKVTASYEIVKVHGMQLERTLLTEIYWQAR